MLTWDVGQAGCQHCRQQHCLVQSGTHCTQWEFLQMYRYSLKVYLLVCPFPVDKELWKHGTVTDASYNPRREVKTQPLPRQGNTQCLEKPDRTPPSTRTEQIFPLPPTNTRSHGGKCSPTRKPQGCSCLHRCDLLLVPVNCYPASVAPPCPDFLEDWCFLQLPG